MTELHHRLKSALTRVDPSLPLCLSPKGVSEGLIRDLEAKINKELPADFLNFYRICDGQLYQATYMVENEEFLSFDRMLNEWSIWKDLLDADTFVEDGQPITSDPDAGIKADWWNPAWIPFTYNGAGDHLCLDLDPADGGRYGQVIRMWHDDGVRTLEYASFKDWLSGYIEDLEQGRYIFDGDYLEKKEEPAAESKTEKPGFWQRLFGG